MNDASDETWDDITEPRVRANGPRVLFVDDDGTMRDLVATHLTAAGYEVYEAASGNELLQIVHSIALDCFPLDGVDLIVLDHRMPGMTGLEAIRRLRALHWETPAILVTAFPEAEVEREAAILDVPIVPKPFSLDLLTSAILASLLSKGLGTLPLGLGFTS